MKKSPDTWIEVLVEGNVDTDLVSGAMYSLGCLGIIEDKDRVRVYFESAKNLSREQIVSALEEFGIKGAKISFNTIADDGWSRRWEKYFEPVRIGEKIYIRPPWREKSGGNLVDIIINPGCAFGTGTHPTTQMALFFLEKYLEKGMAVLDAGCGSGILAIAAVKLGAGNVMCVDNDEGIRENFYENISLNGIQEKVELKICDVIDIDDFDFDLIVSNIDIKSNVKLLNSIGKFGEFPPRMIFTGILEKDMENFITQAETFGLKVTNTGTLKEWGAIVF